MHLNLEGTKHEKAVILILAYVVGFTTGFITFGVTVPNEPAPIAIVSVPAPEPVVHSDTQSKPTPATDSQDGPVSYIEGKLSAINNGASVLLSIQRDMVDEETAKEFANQGVHTKLPSYSVSPDGQFIFYCEQHTEEDNCVPFVYSVTEQIIHYLTLNGAKFTLTGSESASAEWVDGLFSIEGSVSASLDEPWKLVSVQ